MARVENTRRKDFEKKANTPGTPEYKRTHSGSGGWGYDPEIGWIWYPGRNNLPKPSTHHAPTPPSANPDGSPIGGPPDAGPTPDVAPNPTGANRGLKNNNPMNLGSAPGQQGIDPNSPSDGPVGRYRTMADGIAAGARQLLIYQKDGVDTISATVAKWAPAGENDVAGYVKNVSDWTGVGADQKLDLHDPAVMGRVVAAMIRMETGATLPTGVVAKGIGRALGITPSAKVPPKVASDPGPLKIPSLAKKVAALNGPTGAGLHAMLVAANRTTNTDNSHHDHSIDGITVNVASRGSDANSVGAAAGASVRNALLAAQVDSGIG